MWSSVLGQLYDLLNRRVLAEVGVARHQLACRVLCSPKHRVSYATSDLAELVLVSARLTVTA